MKKIPFILTVLLLACILVSCTSPIASATEYSSDVPEILNEDEPVEDTIETQNPTELPKKHTKRPKLPTLDGLVVNDNNFSWNPGSNISGYQIRIAGLDRVNRTVLDYNYKVKADHPYFLLPELNEGEYFLLVKAKSNNSEYLSSDWAVMEYRIGVEASDGDFVDCHNNWEGFYIIFEATEETEGLEARYCFTCLKTHVLRIAALPSEDEWMTFQLINGETEYSVREYYLYKGKPYEELIIPAYHRGKPVTKIDAYGFYRMLNIKTIVIPSTVNKISERAFTQCSNLETIHIDKDNPYYKFETGCLIEIETNKIIAGTNASVIPNYITNIGAAAFHALKMTNIFIPACVKEVGTAAFDSCQELKSVVFENGSQLEKISSSMFGSCISLKDIVLSNNIKGIDNNAFECCTSLKNLIIPPDCIYIGEFAFEGWTSPQTVYIKAFASQAEADKAFASYWNSCDRNGNDQGASFIFLG